MRTAASVFWAAVRKPWFVYVGLGRPLGAGGGLLAVQPGLSSRLLGGLGMLQQIPNR